MELEWTFCSIIMAAALCNINTKPHTLSFKNSSKCTNSFDIFLISVLIIKFAGDFFLSSSFPPYYPQCTNISKMQSTFFLNYFHCMAFSFSFIFIVISFFRCDNPSKDTSVIDVSCLSDKLAGKKTVQLPQHTGRQGYFTIQ